METHKFFSGLLIGAIVGMTTGFLIAPMPGSQVRRKIARRSRAYSHQAIDAVKQYLDNLKRKAGKTVENSLDADEFLSRYGSRNG